MIGVVFVAKPGFIFDPLSKIFPSAASNTHLMHPMHNIGVIAALGAALSSAAAFILVRKLGKKAHPITSVIYSTMISVMLTFVLGFFIGDRWIMPQNPSSFFLLIGIAACGYIGQLFMAKALQSINVAKASTINYSQVLYSFFLEWITFKMEPNIWSVIGATIIGMSIVGISLIKLRRSRSTTTHND